jgi:hypothetical protein
MVSELEVVAVPKHFCTNEMGFRIDQCRVIYDTDKSEKGILEIEISV